MVIGVDFPRWRKMSTSAVADGFVWFPYVSSSYEKARVIGVSRVIFIFAIIGRRVTNIHVVITSVRAASRKAGRSRSTAPMTGEPLSNSTQAYRTREPLV